MIYNFLVNHQFSKIKPFLVKSIPLESMLKLVDLPRPRIITPTVLSHPTTIGALLT